MTPTELAGFIDHSLLKPTLTLADLQKHCSEAQEYKFKTVHIPPTWVKIAATLLKGTSIGISTPIGFPLGYTFTDCKVLEAQKAIQDGATEIDLVINISDAKNESWASVERDIASVVKACASVAKPGIPPVAVKVIIETAFLTKDEKVRAAHAVEKSGGTFVNTSTGFASGVPVTGATEEDIVLLRKSLKSSTLIKASGGIKDLETALALIEAGAARLGTSSGVAILKSFKSGAAK